MPKRFLAPFPLTMDVEFIDRLNEPVRDGKARSVSQIIRAALERYDFANLVVMHPVQVQISVRLPAEIRRTLRKAARGKHTSEGQLVRAAVESYLPELEAAPAPEKKRRRRRTRGKVKRAR